MYKLVRISHPVARPRAGKYPTRDASTRSTRRHASLASRSLAVWPLSLFIFFYFLLQSPSYALTQLTITDNEGRGSEQDQNNNNNNNKRHNLRIIWIPVCLPTNACLQACTQPIVAHTGTIVSLAGPLSDGFLRRTAVK